MRQRIRPLPTVLGLLSLAGAASAAPELRVEIHRPAPDALIPSSQRTLEVVGGASIYGGVRYLDLFLVMDTSKSLRKTDPKNHRSSGAVGLVRSLPVSGDIRIGVVDFDGNTELLSPLTADRDAVVRALQTLDQNGTTDIAEGIEVALAGFEARRRTGASRVILLFTDGKSDAEAARRALATARRRGVAIHTLLLGSDAEGEAILREIADGTSGSFVHVTDPAALPEAFLELRTTGVESVVLRPAGGAPVPARMTGGSFTAEVPVHPGRNRIVATAVSKTGEIRQTEVSVMVSGPLSVSIDAPGDGTLLSDRETEVLVQGSASLFGDELAESPGGDPGVGVREVALRVNGAEPVVAPLVDGRFEARVRLAEGENRIVARATSQDGRTAEDAVRVAVQTPGCAELEVEAVAGGKPALSISERATLIVFDASNSMWGRMEGRPKVSVAKEILGDAMDWIPEDLVLGLRVYGQQHPHAVKNCRDSQLLVPFQPQNRDRIRSAVAGFRPSGQTPIAYTLEQVARDFGEFRGERAVVLVTDGIESCGGDPAAAAQALQSHGSIPVHVIGFGLGGQDEDPASLRAIAAASGGRYLTARSAAELREALAVTVGTPFQVKRDGVTVAHGALGAGDVLQLPEGEYTVRVESSPPYEVPVALERQEGLKLRLKREGGQVLLARDRREIAHRSCDAPAAGDSWQALPAAPAP